MVKPGRLNKLVSVERNTEAIDTFGEAVKTWSALKTDVPASVEPLRGKELFAAQQVQAEISTRVRLRADPLLDDLVAKDRVVNGSLILEIVTVIRPFEKGDLIELMCKVEV